MFETRTGLEDCVELGNGEIRGIVNIRRYSFRLEEESLTEDNVCKFLVNIYFEDVDQLGTVLE